MNRITAFIFLLLFSASAMQAQTGQTNPSLADTLQWMQNTLNSEAGRMDVKTGSSLEMRMWTMPEAASCKVTFEYQSGKAGVVSGFETVGWRAIYKFDLKDIDPTSIRTMPAGSDVMGPKSVMFLRTRNDVASISYTLPLTLPDHSPFTTEWMVFEFGTPYAVRFVKAFKHAVSLCGGKASAF